MYVFLLRKVGVLRLLHLCFHHNLKQYDTDYDADTFSYLGNVSGNNHPLVYTNSAADFSFSVQKSNTLDFASAKSCATGKFTSLLDYPSHRQLVKVLLNITQLIRDNCRCLCGNFCETFGKTVRVLSQNFPKMRGLTAKHYTKLCG